MKVNWSHSLYQRETRQASTQPHPPATHPFPLLRVEYSQTLQHSCAAHTTRSLFTAEQPVTLPGPHSIETLASDPVAAVTPPDVSLLCAAVAGCIIDSGKDSQNLSLGRTGGQIKYLVTLYGSKEAFLSESRCKQPSPETV